MTALMHDERTQIISMAYVTPAVVMNEKDETRRFWEKERAEKYYKGQEVFATSGRALGNHKIALIEILEAPYLEALNANDTEAKQQRLYKSEGFESIERNFPVKHLRWATRLWCESPDEAYVIRYKNLKVVDMMGAMFNTRVHQLRSRNILVKVLTDRKISEVSKYEVMDTLDSRLKCMHGEVVRNIFNDETYPYDDEKHADELHMPERCVEED